MKNLSKFILLSGFSAGILLAGCSKKSVTPVKTTTTVTTGQQNKLLYVDNVSTKDNNGNTVYTTYLMSVNYDGTGATKLPLNLPTTEYIDNGVVSPDNKTLFLAIGTIGGNSNNYDNLDSFPLTGGTTLTTLVSESLGNNFATPIGTIPASGAQQAQLLYSVSTYNNTTGVSTNVLHTANLDGTSDKKITIGAPANTNITGYTLFQDDKTLLVTTSTLVKNNYVYAVATCSIDGSGFTTIGAADLTSNGLGFPVAISGTPSSGSFIFTKLSYVNNNYVGTQLWISNPDLSGLKQISIKLPSSDLYTSDDVGYIPVSPDGKTIFFAVSSHTAKNTSNRGIFSCNLDGSNVHQVVPVDASGVNDYLQLVAY